VNLFVLVISCVFALVAYMESENFKRKNGVTPWHWPSWLWAVAGFLSLVLAAVLLLIARRRTKPVAVSAFPSRAPGTVGSVSSPTLAGSDWYSTAPSRPNPIAHSGITPAAVEAAPSPAWHPDPTGRFASRFWDGRAWTQFVNDGNSTASDPMPV
jgi:Protein of unknown function (DUF2510)